MMRIIVSALLFVTTFAGNLEKLSTPTCIYTSLLFSSGSGPAKHCWISPLGSKAASNSVKSFSLIWSLDFYFFSGDLCSFEWLLQNPNGGMDIKRTLRFLASHRVNQPSPQGLVVAVLEWLRYRRIKGCCLWPKVVIEIWAITGFECVSFLCH